MRRFYDSNITTEMNAFTLSEEESKHVCKVLRMSKGDQLELVNGFGDIFETTIIDDHHKRCIVSIDKHFQEHASNFDIHIAIAPTKMNDRMEWFMEKATELGITEITLLLCSNSERKQIKLDRFEKILVSAMKQSKRLHLPKLNDLTPFSEFVKAHPNGLIAACYDGEKQTIQEAFSKQNCPILIGPEGDFTLDEFALALENGYKSITLGENRLRTETAGLYACMQALMLVQ